MAEYKNFNRCVICRSKKNLEEYHGNFEVTMLLNTLYMAIMHPMEKRNVLHVKSKKIAQYLEGHNIVDKCENDYAPDDITRCLRNGMAHFNIEVDSSGIPNEQISDIKIWAKNLGSKVQCTTPCESPKCLPHKYLEKDGAICIFNFTVESLRSFTNFMINMVLETLEDSMCANCPYREDNSDGNANCR